MTLQRIELTGFKSFAGRTVFDFDVGIAAVVGPNGSGKSNIADAVRWVLGEQNPRLLRGKRAEDVIFAGSASRAPLGMAEARIVLDNADGRLASEFREVSVSRRLYRSGESEYLINGARARLRDVADLLMRVGLGSDSYSVIGQGAIDEMILQRPEERRTLIENAADVRRYRVQIAETASRIASTEQHLARCEDVMAELEPLVRRLRQQAERAERHEAVRGELARVSAAWFRHRFERAEAADAAAVDTLIERDAALAAAENDLQRALAAHAQLEARLRELEGALDAARAEESAAEREEHRLERLDADERAARGALAAAVEGHRQACAEGGVRLDALREEERQVEAALAREREQCARLRDDVQRAEAALELRAAAAREARRVAEARDADLARVIAARAALERQLGEARQGLGQQRERASALAARLDERRAQHAEDAERAGRLAAAAAAAEAALQVAEEVARAASATLRAARERQGTARERARRAAVTVASLTDRARTFDAVPTSGATDGAAALARAGRAGFAGPLSAGLVVEPGREAAVAAALGCRLEALLFDDLDAGWDAVGWLASAARGRAALAIPSVCKGPAPRTAHLHAAARAAHAEATPLLDVVSAAPRVAPLIEALLGAAILAPDRGAARRVAEALWGASTLSDCAWVVVTPGGEAIFADGLLRGGRDAATEALAARGRERAATLERLDAARRDQDRADAALADADAGLTEAERQERAALEQLATARVEARAARAQADEAARQRDTRQRELRDLERQSAEAAQACGELERRGEELAQRLAASERERAGLAEARERAASAAAEARDALAAENAPLLAARAALNAAMAAAQSCEAQLGRLRAEIGRSATRLAEQRAALADGEQRLGAAPPGHADALARLGERRLAAAAACERLARERAEVQRATAEASDVLTRCRERAERERAERGTAALAAHRARDELTRLARDLAEFTEDEQVLDWADQPRQLRLRLEELPGWSSEPSTTPDPERLRKRMLQLQRELRAIGGVSATALEEYRAVAERLAFLERQSADLRRAMAELRGAMAELEGVASERFGSALAAINAAFGECFAQLFGGGQASLVLSDPQSPLEGGVEVVARPPGKRSQALVALSGGERSLTMIALLMALLRVCPAPFCVLDEVDAALDDANVRRFIGMVRGFSARTRFLIVTHNRATMEHADRLYGVTMDASGVSRAAVVTLPPARGRPESTNGHLATTEEVGVAG